MTRLALRGSTAAFLVASAFALTGCPQPVVNDDAGMMMNTGGGAACSPGTVGCGCDNNTCSSGECVDGACVACQRGANTCVCRANGTCDNGLRCASGKCETCPAGQNGCACTGTTCSAGLTCSNGTCVPDTCAAGSVGCPCRSVGPVCDNNAYCDSTNRCQMCSPDVKGCACSSTSMCLGGLVCNMPNMQCRDAVTCNVLRADGGCAANQLCNSTTGQDSVCVPGQCESNFKFDSNTNMCVACVSTNCMNEPTCDVDGGIGGTCDAQNRTCVQAGQVASCGPCKAGFAPNTQGLCQPVPRCGSTTCDLGQFCDTSTGMPRCETLPCPDRQAKDSPSATACTPCTSPASCNGVGYSGRYWPYRTQAGQRCICETLDGYFEPGSAAQSATLCDADNDGWVNALADGTDITQDQALRPNARCTIRRVDRVKLVEETGLTAEVHSCTNTMNLHIPQERTADGGIAAARDGGFLPLPGPGLSACASTADVLPIRLLETPRNDQPGQPMGVRVPQYGDGGRVLEARELNSLTKACVSLAGDFNDNGFDDLTETQPLGANGDDQVRLRSFTYFVELYTAFFEVQSGNPYGALVIQERPRCDSRFPLRYAPNAVGLSDGGFSDSYETAIDGGARYWRSCERRRDPSYNSAVPAPGYDFASWTCPVAAQPNGTCPFEGFPNSAQVGPTDPATTFFRDFGRCNLRGQLPADRRWRGFGHHSQFKCVNITTSNLGGVNVSPNSFDGGVDGLSFNTCVAVQCNPNDAACRTAVGAGQQTSQPVLRCTARHDPPTSSVGFAAVNFRPYGDPVAGYTRVAYNGGCVNEDAESTITSAYGSFVCPFPEFSRRRLTAEAEFGRHSCYLYPANFLWSGPTPQRATLRWSSGDGGMTPLNGVFR